MSRAAPFLKWVGGKRQLLAVLSKLITHKSKTYYEPFLGGGAVFFHFADRRRFQRAILNDANPELINCYTVVRDQLGVLLKRLDAYKADPEWNTETYFKEVRSLEPTDPIEMAARTIYLNRTCFNGLYRVNKAGKFNTPFGKYDNPNLYDNTNIRACSEVLQRFSTLRAGDYTTATQDAQAGDIVYFDPPYVPVSETANFTAYTGQFGPKEQWHLAVLFRSLVDRGVLTIQSNSDSPLVRELYEAFDIHVVGAKRSINSKGDKRGEINELVVVGRPAKMEIDVPAVSYIPNEFPLECSDCNTIYNSADIVCPKCGSTNTE
jgi:DNA adenine methylase